MSLTQYLESQEDQDMTRLLNFTRTQERRREGVFCVWRKRRVRRERVSLTQYLESQEDQDMTRLFYFLELKRGEKIGISCVLWNEGEGGLYSSGGENMNGRPFNED